MSLVYLYYNMAFKSKMEAGWFVSSTFSETEKNLSTKREKGKRLCVKCRVLEPSTSPLSHCGQPGVATELLPAPQRTSLADMRDKLVIASWAEGVPIESDVRVLIWWDDNVPLPFTLPLFEAPPANDELPQGKEDSQNALIEHMLCWHQENLK